MSNNNFQRQLRTWTRVILSPKVGLLLLLFFFILYQGAYEFIIKSSVERVSKLDQQIQQKEGVLKEEQGKKRQLEQWKKELKDLKVNLVELKSKESPNIAAVSESNKVVNIVTEGLKDQSGNLLPPPHDQLKFMSLKKLDGEVVDISGNDTGGKEGGTEGFQLWRYDFEMELEGTFASLSKLINEMTASDTLIVLKEITIAPIETTLPQTNLLLKMPSVPNTPESPNEEGSTPVISSDPVPFIPVRMGLTFSIYLHDPEKFSS